MSAKNCPSQSDESREFWDGASRGEFLLQYDAKADRSQFFPRPASVFSESKLAWQAASGLGTLVAVTTARTPGSDRPASYMIGLIKLDEGPRVFAPLRDAEPTIAPGRRMRLVWESESPRLYAFAPA